MLVLSFSLYHNAIHTHIHTQAHTRTHTQKHTLFNVSIHVCFIEVYTWLALIYRGHFNIINWHTKTTVTQHTLYREFSVTYKIGLLHRQREFLVHGILSVENLQLHIGYYLIFLFIRLSFEQDKNSPKHCHPLKQNTRNKNSETVTIWQV